ncbi:hypothetical protein N7492_010178 [Penicillium capsulatum]|uniref:Uncharacterized protein n=1 Tax=Penicillium capsulatum TaxID=69766 RepID=A0A9W9LEW5_9EURO|nr:hypothetical protein N7492_010178 [Penicillium capsulatum]KAJ6112686.1 hypothetical protein N7512_008010 [Penicillium capsulatum]
MLIGSRLLEEVNRSLVADELAENSHLRREIATRDNELQIELEMADSAFTCRLSRIHYIAFLVESATNSPAALYHSPAESGNSHFDDLLGTSPVVWDFPDAGPCAPVFDLAPGLPEAGAGAHLDKKMCGQTSHVAGSLNERGPFLSSERINLTRFADPGQQARGIAVKSPPYGVAESLRAKVQSRRGVFCSGLPPKYTQSDGHPGFASPRGSPISGLVGASS